MTEENKRSIFTLIPGRIDYNQFWVSMRKRNLWLIYLRYGAFLLLASLITGSTFIEHSVVRFDIYSLPLWITAVSILIYNLIFHYSWTKLAAKRNWHLGEKAEYKRSGFRSLHFAMLQICADFIALLAFVYFTGGVESPMYSFFIFHVIIGSLFLPGSTMIFIISGVLAITVGGAMLEFSGDIPHYSSGIFLSPLYHNELYVFTFFLFFGLMLYTSIYLTNSIAKELYRHQRSLTIAYDKLEESRIENQRYIMSVVHDLKTPISAVITYINMILDGTYGTPGEGIIRPLERSGSRLTNAIKMINNILYLSQLKLQTKIDETETVDLEEMINDICSELDAVRGNGKIKVRFSKKSDDLRYECEPKLMNLALSNILSNAFKYNSEDGIIEIEAGKSGDSLNIRISDTGIGIPEKEQEKIFRDFYRSSVSKKKKIEGSGLGMSIAAQVVQRYGGSISVSSPSDIDHPEKEEYPGTTFVINLPASGNQ